MIRNRKVQIVLFFIIFCVMPFPAHAANPVSTSLAVYTDREREIVFKEISTGNETRLTVDTAGEQVFTYTEPGTYEYRVYESETGIDRDTREYIATVCVFINEGTGALDPPHVAVDNADGSGKPKELRFGTDPGEDDPATTEKPAATTSTARRTDHKKTAEKKRSSTTASARTADPLVFCLLFWVLATLALGIRCLAMIRKEKSLD